MRKRALSMAAFAILAGTAFFVTNSGAQPGTVKLIVPGVWFREGDLQGLGHCNNIIIEMKDYMIVVDANAFRAALKFDIAAARIAAIAKPASPGGKLLQMN